jgi:hypothetical protein
MISRFGNLNLLKNAHEVKKLDEWAIGHQIATGFGTGYAILDI